MSNFARRQCLMLVAAFTALSASSWMFFGSGTLSFGFSASVILQNVDIVRTGGSLHPALDHLAIDDMFSSTHNLSTLAYGDATLGIASRIYVISLPHRADRRAEMDRLRQTLSLQWTYIPAVRSDDAVVSTILAQVHGLRTSKLQPSSDLAEEFTWPEDIEMNALSFSRVSLGPAGSDFWTMPFREHALNYWDADESLPLQTEEGLQEDGVPSLLGTAELGAPTLRQFGPAPSPLTCATKNFDSGPMYTPSLPAYMVLTPAKIACWYSHLEVIKRIANGEDQDAPTTNKVGDVENANISVPDDVALVLEDDVDMERDIRHRLLDVWTGLPPDWDIVFLGHCWSNESFYPAIPSLATSYPGMTLRPSFAPKCTHAYALTRTGARRLLLHLRHPPFAYSRALDQALAWLVLSGRLKAFSIVPSPIVQRKVVESDIDTGGSGMGSPWREHLENGVLGS